MLPQGPPVSSLSTTRRYLRVADSGALTGVCMYTLAHRIDTRVITTTKGYLVAPKWRVVALKTILSACWHGAEQRRTCSNPRCWGARAAHARARCVCTRVAQGLRARDEQRESSRGGSLSCTGVGFGFSRGVRFGCGCGV
eukprot:1508093-Pyramimonas_sp.AAC.1